MKLPLSALLCGLLSCTSYAEYNPYDFYFYLTQSPCTPLTRHYIGTWAGSNSRKNHWYYGSDLDYHISINSKYPPLYIANAKNNSRDYIKRIEIELYKHKNEKKYRLSYVLRSSAGALYEVDDIAVPQADIETIFTDIQFPVKQFAETASESDEYRLGANSIKDLSVGQTFNAFKGFILLINMALQDKKVSVLFDENDLNTKFGFRKKWLSWETWKRWEANI